MDTYLLLGAGGVFGLLLLLNNLIKTLLRREKVGFMDVLLTFLTVFLLVGALVVNHLGDEETFAPDGLVNQGVLIAAGVLLGVSLLILILEVFRPQRLRASRGVLGFFSGILVVLSTFVVPFAAAYFMVRDSVGANLSTTPVATLAPGVTPTAQLSIRERIFGLFNQIRFILNEEIQMDEVELATLLDAGVSLSSIVAENGGNLEVIIMRIVDVTRTMIQTASNNGEIGTLQSALLLSQVETFIRLAVNSDLMELARLGSQTGSGTPSPTPPSFLSMLTASPVQVEMNAPAVSTTTPTPEPSSTSTPTMTREPSATRTPRPTSTPRPTRVGFASPTPLPTATSVTPCLAVVNYNLRLRTAPNGDSETLLVIPYATTISLFAQTEDGLWWQAEYESERGWIDVAFVTLSATCNALPVSR